MPSGVPVATVAMNGSKNAGLLAVQILSVKDGLLRQKIIEYKDNMQNEVMKKIEQLSSSTFQITSSKTT